MDWQQFIGTGRTAGVCGDIHCCSAGQFPDGVYFQSGDCDNDIASAGACSSISGYSSILFYGGSNAGGIDWIHDACGYATQCHCFWFRLSDDMGYGKDGVFPQSYIGDHHFGDGIFFIGAGVDGGVGCGTDLVELECFRYGDGG